MKITQAPITSYSTIGIILSADTEEEAKVLDKVYRILSKLPEDSGIDVGGIGPAGTKMLDFLDITDWNYKGVSGDDD